jgi:xanthine dehydrogenase accessory factor
MNSLSAILSAYQNSQADHAETFLATVVHTKRSTYRKSGARMLITNQSDTTGMISGGCLEQDILCRVQQQTPPYCPFVITYDTSTDEDIVWGFGLGCDGVVQVLVEPLTLTCNPMSLIAECFATNQSGILATVFRSEGAAPIGARLIVHPDGSIESDIEDIMLYSAIATDAQATLKTTPRQYGQTEVLFEVIQPPPKLMIFGAGRDALPLIQFAKALGWHVTVVDCRSLDTPADRFSIADQIILTRRTQLQDIAIAANTIAVVMTHHYEDDLAILSRLHSSLATYIGVLGSRQRTERLKLEVGISAQRLHAPIGLDIGAETPEEIAIAVVAEIQAVLRDRKAGFLCQRSIAYV